tara:strand:+ start:541 stop:768 length:228 start_codon:yes stop_codon:yes gene_type:complete
MDSCIEADQEEEKMTKDLSTPTPSDRLVKHMENNNERIEGNSRRENGTYGPYLHVDGFEFMAIRDDDGWTFRRID